MAVESWNLDCEVVHNNFPLCESKVKKRSLPVGIPLPKKAYCFEQTDWHVNMSAVCIQMKRILPLGRGIRFSCKCKQCDILLCYFDCFMIYHQERDVQV
jgi:hypothetical protein